MSRMARLVVVALLMLTSQAGAERPPRIVIIIDDLGYQLDGGRRALRLPGPVAYAILPGAPRARQLAEIAHSRGKEVLLHLPLEAAGHSGPVEPGSITLDMSHARFRAAFAKAIDSVPFAVGVNSHRGSLLTRHPGHMRWLMEEIRERDELFFVDSYTTHQSVALQIAAETGVAATRRDVFLDHEYSPEAIEREFVRLKSLARRNGAAVAVGHPYPETLEVLERELPKLRDEGIDLISISDLLASEGSAQPGLLIGAGEQAGAQR